MREIEKERRRYTDDRQIGHMYVRYVVNDWYECLRRMTLFNVTCGSDRKRKKYRTCGTCKSYVHRSCKSKTK